MKCRAWIRKGEVNFQNIQIQSLITTTTKNPKLPNQNMNRRPI